MDAWIPFFQSLIWPILIAIVLIVSRKWVREMMEIIKKRVELGSEMSVGPSGFALGSAPKLDQPIDKEEENELLERVDAAISKKEPLAKQSSLQDLMQSIYLVHDATFFKEAGPSYDKRDFYTIRVQLSADSSAILDRVSKVIYYRHPTFRDKTILEVTDRKSDFEMVTRVWGQFNLKAEIYFRDTDQPLTLYRYLNF